MKLKNCYSSFTFMLWLKILGKLLHFSISMWPLIEKIRGMFLLQPNFCGYVSLLVLLKNMIHSPICILLFFLYSITGLSFNKTMFFFKFFVLKPFRYWYCTWIWECFKEFHFLFEKNVTPTDNFCSQTNCREMRRRSFTIIPFFIWLSMSILDTC